MKKAFIFMLVMILSSGVFAKGFQGEVKMNMFKSTGNVELTRVITDMSVKFRASGMDLTGALVMEVEKNDGIKIIEEFEASLLNEYRFVPKHGGYLKLSIYRNEPIGIKQKNRFDVGYVNYLMDKKNQFLHFRLGMQQAQTSFSDDSSETIYYMLYGMFFKYGMGKTWFKGKYDVAKQLEQDGNSETTIEFTVGLGLAKNVGVELSYKTLKLKHPYVAGKETSDKSVKTAIVYSF